MTVDPDIHRAVGERTGNAQQNIAVVELAPVERNRGRLIDPAFEQFLSELVEGAITRNSSNAKERGIPQGQ